jgi:hypothetical protein
MTDRNIPFRKSFFRRALAGIFIFIFTANFVFANSNFLVDVLAIAGVRVAPPRAVAVTTGKNSATAEWSASLHAISGSIDSYRIYLKPSALSNYSDCPPTATELAAGQNCSVEYSFSTDTSEQFSLVLENIYAGTYDFIIRAVKNVGDADFDPELHQSSVNCESCEVLGVVISGEDSSDPEEPPEPPDTPTTNDLEGGRSALPGEEPQIIEPTHESAPLFTDVAEEDWFFDFVTKLKNDGIVDGYPDGSFRPNTPINRAEITKIALAAFRPELDLTNTTSFPDVPLETWFSPFVATAKNYSIVHGYGDGLFRPADSVNRAEAVKILVGAAGFPTDSPLASNFADVAYSEWYRPYVAWAESQGVVSGFTSEVPDFEFSRVLRIGMGGEDVGVLQSLLAELGYYRGVISQGFGEVTQQALVNFQFANLAEGSFQTGVLDENTQNKISEITGINSLHTVYEFRPEQSITRAEVAKIVSILRDLQRDGFSPDATEPIPASQPSYDLSQIKFEEPFRAAAPRDDSPIDLDDSPVVSLPVTKQATNFSADELFERLGRILNGEIGGGS